MVNSAEPTATSVCGRSPASCPRSSRSAPIAPPRTPATTRRTRTSAQLISGSTNGLSLSDSDLLDTTRGQVEQDIELVAVERRALGRRLHLDQPAVAGHDHIHVHLGGGILDVVEVEERLALDDPHR